MVADKPECPGQVAARQVAEGGPVTIREAWDFQRITGDHLDVENDLRPGAAQGLDNSLQVEEPRTERDFREQETVLVTLDSHVLEVSRKRPRRECLDNVHRVFEK